MDLEVSAEVIGVGPKGMAGRVKMLIHNIFPTNVSQIDVSYDSTDTIEEFTVEFQVQTFRAIDAGGPNG